MPSVTAARRAIDTIRGDLARRGVPPVGRVASARAPDQLLALDRYRALADSYERRTAPGDPYRRQTARALAPAPGETILDVGCGTGLNFEFLEQSIGPHGRLIGIDQSPEMIELAHERVARHHWHNVLLLQATAEQAQILATADGALLCGVHDIMRSPAALAKVLGHLRPGGRIVAGGPKWVSWWQPGSIALNLVTWSMNRDYITTFEGFDRPWSHLASLVPELQHEDVCLGGGYIVRGMRPQ